MKRSIAVMSDPGLPSCWQSGRYAWPFFPRSPS
jgi:hypothetical protein